MNRSECHLSIFSRWRSLFIAYTVSFQVDTGEVIIAFLLPNIYTLQVLIPSSAVSKSQEIESFSVPRLTANGTGIELRRNFGEAREFLCALCVNQDVEYLNFPPL
jgi:hypothetical protein